MANSKLRMKIEKTKHNEQLQDSSVTRLLIQDLQNPI